MKVLLFCVCALVQIDGSYGDDMVATPRVEPVPGIPEDLVAKGGTWKYTKMPPPTRAEKHEKDMRFFFDNVDKDKNGSLSKKELTDYMQGDYEMFELIHGDNHHDLDGDGELSWKEWFYEQNEVPTPGAVAKDDFEL
jgi:hypothetical protein